MSKYIYKISIILVVFFISCDNANDLLDQYIKDGPIIYAAKVDTLQTQSGYYRFRVNLYPAEDVNRDYCILSWNITEGLKDSVKIDYTADNFDHDLGYYFTVIDIPASNNIQGSLEVSAQNVDTFGNKSLVETTSAYIYGESYVSSLINAPINISPRNDEVVFEERVGVVGNFISYEKASGGFTEEVFITEQNYPLTDAKAGGIIKTKTRYLINETDIDALDVAEYLETEIPINDAVLKMQQFRETSPFLLSNERLTLLNTFENFSDDFTTAKFNEYLKASDSKSIDMEHTVPILYSYRDGFDKVINGLKNTQVKNGTSVVWLLYNMGFVVKTPSGSYGVDIDHRWADQLEPYLDFLCVTHNHGDHANIKLMDAMNKKGKPVLSNFYTKDAKYLSKVPASYNIGNFIIKTDITDHLADPKLPDFVTVFRIEGGEESGNFSMLHCGDSGFNPSHFTKVQGPVDMAVLRWGAPRENNILGIGSGQVKTDHAVLSHLIELRHEPHPNGQASITQTLKHLPNVNCENTLLPFWGEKMTWENGKMH